MTGGLSRIVALDWGRRRIGVAASDPTGTIASPLDTILHDGSPGIPARLIELLEELQPGMILLGIPLQMDGAGGTMANEARAFGARLADATRLPVKEWDERMSTARAEREIHGMGARRRRRKDRTIVDQLAASLMLSDYLRSRPELVDCAAPERPEPAGPPAPEAADR